MLLDDNCTVPDVRSTIFTRFPQERIIQAISTIDNLVRLGHWRSAEALMKPPRKPNNARYIANLNSQVAKG